MGYSTVFNGRVLRLLLNTLARKPSSPGALQDLQLHSSCEGRKCWLIKCEGSQQLLTGSRVVMDVKLCVEVFQSVSKAASNSKWNVSLPVWWMDACLFFLVVSDGRITVYSCCKRYKTIVVGDLPSYK